MFTKTLIFYYLDLERYIKIKTNVSGYIIYEVLNQLAFKINIADKIDIKLLIKSF